MKGEDMSVFKSYLRQLLVQLQDLRKAIQDGDGAKAEEIVDILIRNTQAGIEDD